MENKMRNKEDITAQKSFFITPMKKQEITKDNEYDVIIIGGGAAGLFCAYEARKKRLKIALIEQKERLGEKLRIAGGGMGNMTNRTINEEHYISHDKKEASYLLKSLFKHFSCDDVLALLELLCIPYEERDFGQIFCLKPVKEWISALETRCVDKQIHNKKTGYIKEYSLEHAQAKSQQNGQQNKSQNGQQNTRQAVPQTQLQNTGTVDFFTSNLVKQVYYTSKEEKYIKEEKCIKEAKSQEEAKKAQKKNLSYHVCLTSQRDDTRKKESAPNKQDRILTANKLVIATGSNAYPQIGASDFGVRLAKKWGHVVYDFYPALVPMTLESETCMSPKSTHNNQKKNTLSKQKKQNISDCLKDVDLKGLEGISLPVRMTVINGKLKYEDPCGARSLLFTHKGVSGPACLVASCYVACAQTLTSTSPETFTTYININFLPYHDILSLMHAPENGKKNLKNLLLPLLPDRLVYRIIPEKLQTKKVAEMSKKERELLVSRLHNAPFIVTQNEGLKKAEAAYGGICVKELRDTMESKHYEGLYFCGEVVDITGLLGGYNIHFALASATRVAKNL